MLESSILAGHAMLDRLPFWIALPLGLGLGAFLGYWLSGSGSASSHVLAMVVALAAVAGLGMSVQRPEARRATPSRPQSQARLLDSDLFL